MILQIFIYVSQFPLNRGWPVNLIKGTLACCFVTQYYTSEFCKSYYFDLQCMPAIQVRLLL